MMIRHIEPVARAAYGIQTLGVMGFYCGLILFVAATVIAAQAGLDAEWARFTGYWLGGWAVGLAITLVGGATAFFFWRYSGDWVTEWVGYAVGLSAPAVGTALLAALWFGTDLPRYLAVIVPAAALFAFSCGVAPHLAGAARGRRRVVVRQR